MRNIKRSSVRHNKTQYVYTVVYSVQSWNF